MLQGKTALVTGSTQGLELTTVERLASHGCNIVMNGLGNAATIEANRRRIAEVHGVRVLHHGADLSKPAEITSLVETALGSFGGVDILVNNAVVRHFAPIEDFKPEDWDRALAVNLSSAFHTTRLVLPGMRQRDFGRIVNIASIFGLRAAVNRIDYVTTKTALIGLTRAVALETVTHGITCNAVCPGTSETPVHEEALRTVMAAEGVSREEAERRFFAGKQPAGRFIAAENVAALIAFLCGPEGADITGSVLPIDGGWSAA